MPMNQEEFSNFESAVFDALEGKLSRFSQEADRDEFVMKMAKYMGPSASDKELQQVVKDSRTFTPISKYIGSEDVEDIMVNNLKNIFVYFSKEGSVKVPERIEDRKELDMLMKKLKMYATASTSNRQIYDVHLANGSRVNIVDSPLGADITIRNFKGKALSIIDLINAGEFSYNMAGRLWLYAEGLRIRPANILIGGMPAAGKTTLLNAMFSFFRPEQRIVVIEDTYELNTETQENTVRLETSPDITMEDLVKNSLRMRPDMIIVGEVRGAEAKDMMTAMNIGKICMSTLHASTARDIVNRLQHTPMNVEQDIVPLIDALIAISQVYEDGKPVRKITQVTEISGIEKQVLLSDLYTYDYKTRKGSPILPSVTYRDTLARLSGLPPSEIVIEEQRRGKILEKLNTMGIRDLRSINEFCRQYYESPEMALQKIGLEGLGTISY